MRPRIALGCAQLPDLSDRWMALSAGVPAGHRARWRRFDLASRDVAAFGRKRLRMYLEWDSAKGYVPIIARRMRSRGHG